MTSNTTYITESSDIFIGSRTEFHGNVVIQNFIAGNDGLESCNSNAGNLETASSGTFDSVY